MKPKHSPVPAKLKASKVAEIATSAKKARAATVRKTLLPRPEPAEAQQAAKAIQQLRDEIRQLSLESRRLLERLG